MVVSSARATRLSASSILPPSTHAPAYDRAARKTGIVHLGTGAFHKAHQAVYTDDALAAGGDWMIAGVSLRSPDVADALNPQDGLYTLVVRGAEGVSARVVGSIAKVLVAPREPQAVMAALTAPETKIVSLTITEKGYGLDPKTGGLDRAHASVAPDLADPRRPAGAVGLIVEALRLRRARGVAPFTALCCDNLPHNGKVLKRLVGEFAAAVDAELGEWIAANVTFPSTMVDRITPASTEATLAEAERLTGFEDRAAVETEPFTQWVIEDDFVAGRPAWEAGGAIFATDVAPYEKMKLRMLNGAHSMLAYSGYIAGHQYVRDVMRDAALARLVARHMDAAARTLDPVPGVDLEAYKADLLSRFANPAIAHQTYQIAMDGTQKLPQRLIEPAIATLRAGGSLDAYAFAAAAWMRYCLGMDETGQRYALRDPREAEIAALLGGLDDDSASIVDRLLALPGLFPHELAAAPEWRRAVQSRLETMLADGMRRAIESEARG
ncbi:mannitol dehydrogenase family protein [Mesorhizobium australicum]|uniref:Fructuronate reductase n=1 Tax=Mesorhizobium australicum TaxID=536018 RepID=A0A1X7PQX5_9HYPH|nr:mannitol dehydrogenase family protein [Mesorhizobium australicum]SMH53502.1 fructuronate reductase [Mesorhizobium australicum]